MVTESGLTEKKKHLLLPFAATSDPLPQPQIQRVDDGNTTHYTHPHPLTHIQNLGPKAMCTDTFNYDTNTMIYSFKYLYIRSL